jgi:organic hydroperoxide reductase OsmC/OhrA
MQPYPHLYTVSASGTATGVVPINATELPVLNTAPPREFDGPGDQWSPESMLCAAIASCFILTFRAVARASKLEWSQLTCNVAGTLERVEDESRFTQFVTQAKLTVAKGIDAAKARRAMEKAEHGCLVSNTLRAARVLELEVIEQ